MKVKTLYAIIRLTVEVPDDMDEYDLIDEVGANFEYDIATPEDSEVILKDTEWMETTSHL